MSYARVVPTVRTILGVESFDYLIPEGMTIRKGDLVRVPFRRRETPALVIDILKTSPFAEKALPLTGSYGGISFPESLVELLEWTAQRTFTSRPTVLKAWLRQLPKRQPLSSRPEQQRSGGTPSLMSERSGPSASSNFARDDRRDNWTNRPQAALLERAREILKTGKRVLILTPAKTRLLRLQSALSGSLILQSDLSDGEAFRRWTSFLMNEGSCLIATRIGAWLSPVADFVLIDEPENDDHKQDDSSPRYDARLLAARAGTSVETFGLTPPLARGGDASAPAINVALHVSLRHPQGRSPIPMIQGDSLEQLRAHEGSKIIIHPIRGDASGFACRDCGWRALCPHCGHALHADTNEARCPICGKTAQLPNACAICGGADLGKALPGVEKLKRAWTTYEPELNVEWRDLTNESLDAPLPKNVFVLVTDGSLLGGTMEDIRRRERRCIAYRRLADRVATAGGTLMIQSDEAMAADWVAWLTAEGFANYREQERAERKAFNYPPAVRVVKVIMTSDSPPSEGGAGGGMRGPYPVPFRGKDKEPRYIIHYIFPNTMTEEALTAALAPLAKSAIIDLDPIAFFR